MISAELYSFFDALISVTTFKFPVTADKSLSTAEKFLCSAELTLGCAAVTLGSAELTLGCAAITSGCAALILGCSAITSRCAAEFSGSAELIFVSAVKNFVTYAGIFNTFTRKSLNSVKF